jgi:hypothetical protein
MIGLTVFPRAPAISIGYCRQARSGEKRNSVFHKIGLDIPGCS